MVERFTLNLFKIFFLAKTFTYFLRVFRCLACFELSTGSVHCAPDEIDRLSEQTKLYFALVTLCCFIIIFSVSSLKYVRRIFNNYLSLTLSNKNKSSSLLTCSEKISVFKVTFKYQKIDPYKHL